MPKRKTFVIDDVLEGCNDFDKLSKLYEELRKQVLKNSLFKNLQKTD